LGFWTLALFYNWAGTHHLIGGPLPSWLVTVGIVGSVMMFVPVVTVAINHHLSMFGHFHRLIPSYTLRFTVFGAMSYTLVSIQGSLTALRTVNRVTHFTHYTIAHAHLGVYAFYTMLMFASMYYILPRITLKEWPSRKLIEWHFWCTSIGISLYFIPLTIGGIVQGIRMNVPDYPQLKIVQEMVPYLQIRTLSGVLLAVGHFAFIWSCLHMFRNNSSGQSLPADTSIQRQNRIQAVQL
jgi:cytochrome c oxidase cbb3-type subunit 1